MATRKVTVTYQQQVVPAQYDVFQDSVDSLIRAFDVFGFQISDSRRFFHNVRRLLRFCQHQCLRSVNHLNIVDELSRDCNSPLHIACKIGDLSILKELILSKYVDTINKDGDTPLHVACQLGYKHICEYITEYTVGDISNERDIVCHKRFDTVTHHNIMSDESWWVLDRTVCDGKVLISKNLPSILTKNKRHESPFQVALQFKMYSCLKIIAELPKFKYILLLESMTLINLDCEEISIDDKEFKEAVVVTGAFYSKYLNECIDIANDYKRSNHTRIVAHVGFIPHFKNDSGLLPIETLIQYSDKRIANVISDIIKCNPYFWHEFLQTDYNTFYDTCEKLELFESNKHIWIDLCNKKDKKGNLLPHCICRYNKDDTITRLLSQCDINTRNKLGKSLLWEAFSINNFSMCTWLALEKQCDIYGYHKNFNRKDISVLCDKIEVPSFKVAEVAPGDTLFHAAAVSGDKKANIFLAKLIGMNCINCKQQYPLHVVCTYGQSTEAIHILRECDITHKDIDGNTPLDLLYKHHPNRHDLMACAMGSSYYIPGVTPTPCSVEELVSTEWFRNLGFKELEKHYKFQNNPLHIAAENGSIDVIENLKKYFPNLFYKYLSEKNLNHDFPLHYAAVQRNLYGIKMLSEVCNVNAVNLFGHTCLHEACRNATNSDNDYEVVEYLIEKLKCNASICDQRRRSALHMACKNGNFKLVEIILAKTEVDPNIKDINNCTPLMLTSLDHHDIIKLLIEHGADTSCLYDTYKEFFKRYQSENPPPTPLNVIVAGKPSSGKSTVIKALCSDGSQTIVHAEPHTAGIIPSSHQSDQLGCVSFYDLAGQSEYYASHEAVLHTVMASSTPLILLLIDCRKDQGLIQQDILYWLHFFNCQLPKKSQPHVILLFSFADQIPDQLVEKKFHCCKKTMQAFFTKTNIHLANISFLDCRISNSEEIEQLRISINASASILRDSAPINFLLHSYYAFLLHSFRLQPAVRICDVVDIKQQWISLGIDPNTLPSSDSDSSLSSLEELDVENEPTFEEENPANLLPDNTTNFLRLSKRLHQKGHVIFIENHDDANKSWLIINKEILLHEINGSLFAPNILQRSRGIISTSTGVVAASKISDTYEDKYNTDMLIGFLLHLEYCQKITDDCVLELLSSESSFSSDEYYYFPGLVTIEKPTDVWNTPTESVVQCGWILRVEDAKSFYTPRLVQILLLRVAFQNAFPVKDFLTGFECLSICRSCSVWKNGIFWRNETEIECLLEVTEESQAIVFMLRSSNSNPQSETLKEFLFFRSFVIKTILDCVEEICPFLKVLEYFCHPDHLQYPIKHCNEIGLYSMENVARAICQKSKFVRCNNPRYENLTTSRLLYFEPFMHCCISAFFNESSQNELIVEEHIKFIATCISSGQHSKVLTELISIDEDEDDVTRLLQRWRDKTYKDFRMQLSKFSIFKSRDPQVLGRCSVKHVSSKSYAGTITEKTSNLTEDYSAVLVQLYSKLVEELQFSIDSIADHSRSKNLITRQTYGDILDMSSRAGKTRKLLMNVEQNIASRPGPFEDFCEVLEECEFSDLVKCLKSKINQDTCRSNNN